MILDIFAQNAHSQEGKAQVELAQLRYRLPRFAGHGHALSQQAAVGIGTRGPGETQLEVDRRRIAAPHPQARGRPAATSRRHRVDAAQGAPAQRQSLASSIVGYTNAGKSTLLNRLTDAGVLVEDRLFATLDATTRRLQLPGGETVLVSDTVGFVRKLPHQLVEAFKSTLEVVADADLLVHVVDASAPDPEGQIDAVRAVLDRDRRRSTCPSCSCSTRPTSRRRGQAARRTRTPARSPSRPTTGEGIDELLARDRRPAAGADRGRRAAHPVRPRRRARRGAPRGRGARRDAPTTTACACGPALEPGRRRPAPRVRRSAGRRPDPLADEPRQPASSRRRTRTTGSTSSRRSPTRTTGGCVDLSVGTPVRPAAAGGGRRRWRRPNAERGYPASIGSLALPRRGARLDATGASASPSTRRTSPPASAPRSSWRRCRSWLRLRDPDRDTVLYPGDQLPDLRDGRDARRLPRGRRPGRRRVAPRPRRPSTPTTPRGRCACGSTRRATPPAGSTTSAPPRRGAARTTCRCSATSATSSSPGTGRRARSSRTASTASSRCTRCRSARTSPACAPASTPATPSSSTTSREVRKHVGLMVPGPVQAAAVAAFADDAHVDAQRERYRRRLERMAEILRGRSASTPRMPQGGFYLWVPAPGGDAWGLARDARRARPACSCRPASSTAPPARGHVRVAVVQPDDRDRRCVGLTRSRPSERRRGRSRVASAAWPTCRHRSTSSGSGATTLSPADTDAVRIVHEAIDLLDTGRGPGRRGRSDGEVVVHQWLKQAILLLFRSRRWRPSSSARSSTPTRSRSSAATQRPACGSCPARRPGAARSSTAASS